MRYLSLAAVGLVVSTVPLLAQSNTTISPKGAATTSGNTNNNIPYSWYPTRYQQIYNYDTFSHGQTPFVVKQVAYRMNKSFANGKYGGQTIELSMWLGRAPAGTNSGSYNMTFDKNFDAATKVLVINRKKFLAPKLANTNFDFKLPLDSPTTLIPTTQRATVMEVIYWGNTNNNTLFTYPLDAASSTLGTGIARLYAYESPPGGGSYIQNGTYGGCTNSNNSVVRQYASAGNIKVGSSTGYAYAYGYIPNIPGIGILGAIGISVSLGGGCQLGVVPILLFPGTGSNNTSGRIQQNFAVPNDPTFGGISFLYQTIFLELGKPQQLVSTRTIKITIGTGKPTPPDQFKDARGSTKNYGLITQFGN